MEENLGGEVTVEIPRLVSTKPTNSLYQPLSSSKESIRLLSLVHPTSPFHENGLMDFKLEHFDLSHCPPCLALSYTWGTQWPTRGIRLNGSLFTVGENLSSALQYIFRTSGRMSPDGNDYVATVKSRYGSDTSGTWEEAARSRFMEEAYWKYVWIDAICIDQVDILEKNQQVSIMSRIFSSAAFVLVWLGDEKDNSDRAMQDLARGVGWRFRQKPGKVVQRAVRALFRRSYWSRLWIVSEFFHAKDILICCGSKCVKLQIVSRWFNGQHCFEGQDASAKSLIGPAYAILNHRFDWNANLTKGPALLTNESRSLLSIVLQRFITLKCRDPRDKVYGLLSLVGKYDDSNSAGKDLGITVDYNRSTHDLYCEVLRVISECFHDDPRGYVMFKKLLAEELAIPAIEASRLETHTYSFGFLYAVKFQAR